jgi:hypothetical protein
MASRAAAFVALCALLLASTAHAARLSPGRELLQAPSDCSRIPHW